ncbi:GNAT family N-acetyltransferase [Umezawaea sp. NPDC059074]|uniref:GNAT family N-acetyltransferase n=1 Tax=Umezawaea sp. NPDC059074 TaxID=3346716 RepID=UPI0036C07716
MTEVDAICLRPWAEGDLGLLRAQNTAEMQRHLGGPVPEDELLDRHRRYTELSAAGNGCMYVVLLGPDSVVAGSVGYWEKEWGGRTVYEAGWQVLPEFQGRGVASRAAAAVARIAAADGDLKALHAFPPVVNEASIAVCRKAGFELAGECDFEYPKGTWIRCEDWWTPLG